MANPDGTHDVASIADDLADLLGLADASEVGPTCKQPGNAVRWLKIGLVVNGVAFLWRGSLDILQPTSFYFEPAGPESSPRPATTSQLSCLPGLAE